MAGWQKAEGRGVLANASKIAHDIANDTSQITINGELQFRPPARRSSTRSEDAELIVVGTDGRGSFGSRFARLDQFWNSARHAHLPVAATPCMSKLRRHILRKYPDCWEVHGSPTSELATRIAIPRSLASPRGFDSTACVV